MVGRSLRFDLIARDKSFSKILDQAGRKGQKLNRELTRTLGGAGDKAGHQFGIGLRKRMGGGFSLVTRMATRAAGLIGAAFAAVQVGQFLKGAIDEAREAAKVNRVTAARIKSTGGAAKVTAKDIDRLAGSLMRTVAVDDDIIKAGENILLTFKGVRNEVGAGNRIFDRATRAAVDLAAGLHQGQVTAEGLQGANIQLGKALEDPIRGITALRRAGVSFTQAQWDQIKTLVETGHKLEAQKIILKAVEQQFGGTAKAAADPWQRVNVIMGELKERLGTALLSLLKRVADWLSVKLPAAFNAVENSLRTAREWWDHNKDAVQVLGDALNTIFVPAAGDAAAGTDDMRTSAQKLEDALDSTLEVVLRVTQGFILVARLAGNVSLRLLDLVVVGGKTINVIDRLSGGSGHAGDAMVDWARDMRDQTRVQLGKLEQDAKDTQRAIDKLHGKHIDITGSLKLNFSSSFTQQDWVQVRTAAGRMAKGGRIIHGTGPTADDVLAWLSRGETVVPAADSARPEFRAWAGRRGIPGFRAGGFVGQTGTQAGAVNRAQARGTRSLMDRGMTKLLAGRPGVIAFIRSTDPLPYIWGAAGPGGYDCSGLVSAVLGKHTGAGGGSGQRYFTTSSIHPGILGIRSGLGGILQIGVTAGTGHMAGRYAGLGFEAESTATGIKIGAAASRPESFARHFHLAQGGLVNREMLAGFAALSGADIGGDQGRLRINGMAFAKGGYLNPRTFSYAKHLLQRIRSGAQIYEDFTWRSMPRSYGHWNDEVQQLVFANLTGGYDFPRDLKKVGPILGSLIHRSAFHARSFDQGGWLMPGATLAVNRTGHPEPVGMPTVRLEIHSGGSRVDDLLVELLKKTIRTRGGNVQVVLGQG